MHLTWNSLGSAGLTVHRASRRHSCTTGYRQTGSHGQGSRIRLEKETFRMKLFHGCKPVLALALGAFSYDPQVMQTGGRRTHKGNARQARAQNAGDGPSEVVPGGCVVASPVGRMGARAWEAGPARARRLAVKPLKVLQSCCVRHRVPILTACSNPLLRKGLFLLRTSGRCTSVILRLESLDKRYKWPVVKLPCTPAFRHLMFSGLFCPGSPALRELRWGRHLVSAKLRLPVMLSRARDVTLHSATPYRLWALYSRVPSKWVAVMGSVLNDSGSSALPLLTAYGGDSSLAWAPVDRVPQSRKQSVHSSRPATLLSARR